MQEEQEIEYKIKVTPWYRWHDDYNYWEYSNDSDHEYELCEDSIDRLYESIARDYNQWIVRMEQQDKVHRNGYSDEYKLENNGIKYSPIYIEVEPYSEEKRNATEAYKNLGAVRDKFIAEQRAKEEAERIRAEKWRKEEQEKKEKAEFERLSKKFGRTA